MKNNKKFKFDICICGHAFKDIIYKLDTFPKENSNQVYNAESSVSFGGIFNTLRGLRFLNKKINIKAVTVLGKDEDGKNAIKDLKKLKVNHNSTIFNNLTNTSLHLINKKNNTKTFIVRFLSGKLSTLQKISDSRFVHFMYLDNKEFLDQFGKLVLSKKEGQFFSADISNRSIFKNNLKKYLNNIDFLICSTKELPSLFNSKKCVDFNLYSLKKLKELSHDIENILVHNKSESKAFINGKIISLKNKKSITNENSNITGAGDTYAAYILNEFLTKNLIETKSISGAHRFASDYCLGKLY